MQLTDHERTVLHRLREIKAESGSHSPSLFTLSGHLPGLELKVDACFLSNPYATDLFIERLQSDLIATGELRKVLESYPSPNSHVAAMLQPVLGVDRRQLFVCNGAVEAIQAAIHRFAGSRVAVVLPTFSPYYEYLRPDQEVVVYRLSRDDDFAFDVDDFAAFVEREGVDTVCLINPNNPNGGYTSTADMLRLLEALSDLALVILDESFVDFAWEDAERRRTTLTVRAAQMPNVVLVKSMSKDFGIAGVRAAYAVMAPERLDTLLGNGYLWNISGLAEYFFRLFTERQFERDYEWARQRYISEAQEFFDALDEIPLTRRYPSMANFALVELDPSVPIELVAPLMLIRHGVYVRDCRDKIGLEDGQYLRIASRKAFENEQILEALSSVVAECHVRA
jgi:histidinol-phosphate/aromatic aminotransferase/cobyric acid decarboxylase-like protein